MGKNREASGVIIGERRELQGLPRENRASAPKPARLVRFRHFDEIPAGKPREFMPAGRMWIDLIRVSFERSWYTLRVTGDSMSPGYLDGDIVMMDYARQPRSGDIVAALIDDHESTLRAYSRKGDEITLTPIETKLHSPRTFHASRIKIQGVLVEIARRVATRKR
jgi:SOS-response transcriptional repressor LexA